MAGITKFIIDSLRLKPTVLPGRGRALNTVDVRNFPTDGKDHGCFSFLLSVIFSICGDHSSQLNSTTLGRALRGRFFHGEVVNSHPERGIDAPVSGAFTKSLPL